MAPKVQYKDLKPNATIKNAESILKDTKGWQKAGDIASDKLATLIDDKAGCGRAVMLSFSPMITFKYIMQGQVKNNFGRKGAFLVCTSCATQKT